MPRSLLIPMEGRAQFSLATLVLAVITLGAVMGFFFARHDANAANDKVAGLRADAESLRKELHTQREALGGLNIEDPSKIWARAMPGTARFTWRWRIYVPKDGWYRVCNKAYEISDGTSFSFGAEKLSLLLNRGEFTVEASVHRTGKDTAELNLSIPGKCAARSFSLKKKGFRDWLTGECKETGVTSESASFVRGSPVELLRLRAVADGGLDSARSSDSCPGLHIWLEDETMPPTFSCWGPGPTPANATPSIQKK